jgi:hypothetical protein
MRKIILIASMVLTSAAAHAGETRGLSTAAAPSVVQSTIQTPQLQAQNEATVVAPGTSADTPRYVARPVPTDNAPITASTAPSTATSSTDHPERRYDDRGYYDSAGYHPSPRRYTDGERPHGHTDRPHHRGGWSASRIIAELHSYGIYW